MANDLPPRQRPGAAVNWRDQDLLLEDEYPGGPGDRC